MDIAYFTKTLQGLVFSPLLGFLVALLLLVAGASMPGSGTGLVL